MEFLGSGGLLCGACKLEFMKPALLFVVYLQCRMKPVLVPGPALIFGVAVMTGVIFGLYPARKASRMDPVEALRHAG